MYALGLFSDNDYKGKMKRRRNGQENIHKCLLKSTVLKKQKLNENKHILFK